MDKQSLPKHVAFIMDGNRRWARDKNLPTIKGHEKGVERVKEIIQAGNEMGIAVMTFYCFSTENWKRTRSEVKYLMRLFNTYIKKYIQEFEKEKIQFRHIGRKDRIPNFLLKTLQEAEENTKENSGTLIQFAIDYGGRDEIVRAIQKAQKQNIEVKDEETFQKLLDTKDEGRVDLMIRTSGEERISNFLIWQIAYAECMFIPQNFPDFTVEIFKKLLNTYKERKRRWGK